MQDSGPDSEEQLKLQGGRCAMGAGTAGRASAASSYCGCAVSASSSSSW